MANLEFEFIGFKDLNNCITVDGKFVKLKKTRKKTYKATVETNNKSEVVIYKTHYYNGKNWFWWNLLYYIVSIFGIFDIKQDKKCLVLDAKFSVTTQNDSKVIVKRQNFEDNGKLVSIETEAQVEEFSNVQYHDKEARKKHKKMKKFKIITTIVSMIIIITLIVIL